MKTINRSTPIALALACLAGSALAQNQPIRIGVVTPLSGTYAGIGQQVKWGLTWRLARSMPPAVWPAVRWNSSTKTKRPTRPSRSRRPRSCSR